MTSAVEQREHKEAEVLSVDPIRNIRKQGSKEGMDDSHTIGDLALENISESIPMCGASNSSVVVDGVSPRLKDNGNEYGTECNTFLGEWDEEGVYFYQAFNDRIADWALENQRFGGPDFNPVRMTWIKPSFAWVLYRAGYGHKDKNQSRILKIKLAHAAVAEILSRCRIGHGNGGGVGRVQWDPSRTLFQAAGHEPARDEGRAIQIGMKGELSCFYVSQVLSIVDVTSLAHDVQHAHSLNRDDCRSTVEDWLACGRLPNERPYMPQCSDEVLSLLRLSR
jgi:hypothetical protein|mmetsp:Transcript_45996/g.72692  ORF Transcript_45996/g.72692 Transcript_45996/m.72692 type:complete len:279 (-) Transcript_45996:9-845(-)